MRRFYYMLYAYAFERNLEFGRPTLSSVFVRWIGYFCPDAYLEARLVAANLAVTLFMESGKSEADALELVGERIELDPTQIQLCRREVLGL